MSQCTCITDKEITCIVHPTTHSLKERIAELEQEVERHTSRNAELVGELVLLRTAICIIIREELSLDGLMQDDFYVCDSPDDLAVAAFLNLAAEYEPDLSVANPLFGMATALLEKQ